ncbi:MAG: transposase [Candidatus Bathyarchaeia archaeon]
MWLWGRRGSSGCRFNPALEEGFNLILANARQVKAIPGRKTDQADSERLAQLLRSGLVKPSYVPERRTRQLRELTRLRVRLVEARTEFKSRAHKVLESVNVRLPSALMNIFGKAGIEVVEGLMQGLSIGEILDKSANRTLMRRAVLEEAVRGGLEETDILTLKMCVEMVENPDTCVEQVDCEEGSSLRSRMSSVYARF